MSETAKPSIGDDEWTIVRDFSEDDNGDVLSQYMVKYVDGIDKRFIDEELVFVKEVNPRTGERIYQLPRSVFETIAHRLPNAVE